MMEIPPADIRWGPSIRLWDLNGRVFFWDNRVFRAIYPHRLDFVRRLFDEGIIDELVSLDLLVPSWLTEYELEGFGAVVEHERQDVDSKPWEWPHLILMEAARVYLQLLRILDRHGLTLHDGHAHNFSLAPGGRVRWHDFGSLVEQEATKFPGLSEFMESLMWPLELADLHADLSILRRLQMRVTTEDFLRLRGRRHNRLLLKSRARILRPAQIVQARLAHSDARGLRTLSVLIHEIAVRMTRRSRPRADASRLDQIEKLVDRFKPIEKTTLWSSYYGVGGLKERSAEASPREKEVVQVLREFKPQRVLDIGANEGLFSRLAAEIADVVIATDTDEEATHKHVLNVRSAPSRIRVYPLFHNILTLTDAEAERMRSDVVLALALTHHLRLGAGFPFDYIAQLFARLTRGLLVTEFMPNGLGGVERVVPDPLPDDYNLESFMGALSGEFNHVDSLDIPTPPNRSTRILVICRRPTI